MAEKKYNNVLPDNYEKAYEVNASDKKMIWLFNIAAVVFFVLGVFLFFPNGRFWDAGYKKKDAGVIVILAISYLYVHELIHGASFYLLTKEKFHIGVKLPFYFYCGTKGYVCKKYFLITSLSPLVVMTILYLGASVYFSCVGNVGMKNVMYLLESANIGSSAADILTAIIVLIKFRNLDNYYVGDDGPNQSFFVKKEVVADVKEI